MAFRVRAFALLLLCSVALASPPQCWFAEGTWNGSTHRASTFDALADQYGAYYASSISTHAPYDYSYTSSTCTFGSPGSGVSGNCTMTGRRLCPECSPGNQDIEWSLGSTVYFTSVQDDCPEDACSDKEGEMAFVGGGSPAGDAACNGGCAVSTSQPSMQIHAAQPGGGTGPTIYESHYTGMSCTDEPMVKPANCVSGAFGRVCASKTEGKNCGTLNGDRVCVETVPSGCKSFASGGVACKVEGEGAVDEDDLPNDGEEMPMPADPDMQVSREGNVVNYYNHSTVTNSTNTVTTGSGEEGDSEGMGDDEDEEDTGGEMGDVGEYGDSAGEFYGRIEGAPLVAAVSGIAGSIPEGECPQGSVTLFGQEIVMDIQCTLWEDIVGIISAVMLAVWALAGIKIIMSA